MAMASPQLAPAPTAHTTPAATRPIQADTASTEIIDGGADDLDEAEARALHFEQREQRVVVDQPLGARPQLVRTLREGRPCRGAAVGGAIRRRVGIHGLVRK